MKVLAITSLLLLVICQVYSITPSYINPSSSCLVNCGNATYPFQNIKSALQYTINDSKSIFLLSNGVYTSTYLEFSNKVSIQIRGLSNNVVIDCMNEPFITFKDVKQVTISNVKIKNCRSLYGSAINSLNSGLTLSNVVFDNNLAEKGGALYIEKGTFKINNCTFSNNVAREMGNDMYLSESFGSISNIVFNSSASLENIYASSSTITLSSLSGTTPIVTCKDSSLMENNDGSMTPLCELNSRSIRQQIEATTTSCGNGQCETGENCLNCPGDCNTCYFSGYKMDSSTTGISSLIDFSFLASITGTYTVQGYFDTISQGDHVFRFTTNNLNLQVNVNGKIIYSSLFSGLSTNTASVYMRAGVVNSIEFVFSPLETTSTQTSLYLDWMPAGSTEYNSFQPYFSLNRCGDGILDLGETCSLDLNAPTFFQPPTCGDNICQESDPNSCLIDCYWMITPICPPLSVGKKYLPPIAAISEDTMGSLMENQIIWNVPGLHHFSHGIDIVTGSEMDSPLFYFHYCQGMEYNIVEDVYRNAFFATPNEVDVVPVPKCEFSVYTDTFSSSTDLQNEYTTDTTSGYGGEFGVNVEGVNFEPSASYSKNSIVEQASEMTSEQQGNLYISSVDCTTYQVSLKSISLHPQFLQDVALANTVDDFVEIIQTYGNYFYTGGSLGGQLLQMSTFYETSGSSLSQSQVETSSDLTFQFAVTCPVGSVIPSYQQTSQSTIGNELYNTFLSSSSITQINTFGGAAGSFGPNFAEDAPGTYSEWAQSVDLNPVPLGYKLAPVRVLISPLWMTKSNVQIQSLWIQAENTIYAQATGNPVPSTSKSMAYYFVNKTNTVGTWYDVTSVNPLFINVTQGTSSTISVVMDLNSTPVKHQTTVITSPTSNKIDILSTLPLKSPIGNIPVSPLSDITIDVTNPASPLLFQTQMPILITDYKGKNQIAFWNTTISKFKVKENDTLFYMILSNHIYNGKFFLKYPTSPRIINSTDLNNSTFSSNFKVYNLVQDNVSNPTLIPISRTSTDVTFDSGYYLLLDQEPSVPLINFSFLYPTNCTSTTFCDNYELYETISCSKFTSAVHPFLYSCKVENVRTTIQRIYESILQGKNILIN